MRYVTQIFIQDMAKIEMTEKERRAFIELNTFLTGVVLQNPVVDPDVAKGIADKARIMQGCMSFPKDIRDKYREIAEIFTKFSDS